MSDTDTTTVLTGPESVDAAIENLMQPASEQNQDESAVNSNNRSARRLGDDESQDEIVDEQDRENDDDAQDDDDDASHDDDALEDEENLLEQDEEGTEDDLFDDADEDGTEVDEDDDDLDTLTLTDEHNDAIVTVTVDGVEEEVTLDQLKRRYSLGGATEKRLQEATETRDTTKKLFDNGREVLETVLKEFGSILLRRTVPEPTAELRASDPQQYLLEKDAFDSETNALEATRQKLADLLGEAEAAAETARQERVANARKDLYSLPVMKDPVKGKQARAEIVKAGLELGFSRDEIANCEDGRLFRLALAAARGMRAQKAGQKARTTRQQERTRTTKKKIRTRKPPSQAARNQATAKKRAQETGSVDDVAATLISPPTRRNTRS